MLLTLLGGYAPDADITTYRTWVVGETATAEKLNVTVRDNLNFLSTRPAFRVTHTGDQNIPNLTRTALHLGKYNDPYGYFDGARPWHDEDPSNDEWMQVQRGGVWRFDWCVMCACTPPGWLQIDLVEVFGNKVHAREQMYSTVGYVPMSGSTEVMLNEGSLVMLVAVHNFSGTFTVQRTASLSPVFSGHWVREQ